MTSVKDTVERLRVVAHNENLNNGMMRGTTPLMLEAAAFIERLAEENESLKQNAEAKRLTINEKIEEIRGAINALEATAQALLGENEAWKEAFPQCEFLDGAIRNKPDEIDVRKVMSEQNERIKELEDYSAALRKGNRRGHMTSIKDTVDRLREELLTDEPRTLRFEAADIIERLAGALEPLLNACIEEYGEPEEEDMTHVGWSGNGEPMAITFQMLADARRALSGEPT